MPKVYKRLFIKREVTDEIVQRAKEKGVGVSEFLSGLLRQYKEKQQHRYNDIPTEPLPTQAPQPSPLQLPTDDEILDAIVDGTGCWVGTPPDIVTIERDELLGPPVTCQDRYSDDRKEHNNESDVRCGTDLLPAFGNGHNNETDVRYNRMFVLSPYNSLL